MMTTPLSIKRLNEMTLSDFKPLFARLSTPEVFISGTYKSEFVGPGWLRMIAPRGLYLGGLGGWWGKQFDTDGQGVNLVMRRGKLEQVLPLQLKMQVSLIDGLPVTAVHYPPSARFPWSFVIDELRQLDNVHLLGMTYAKKRGLQRLPLPFLLKKVSEQ